MQLRRWSRYRPGCPTRSWPCSAAACTTGLGAALNTAAVIPASGVAVIGCGGVGQSVIQGARIVGAAVIIAIDPVPGRREASMRVGATHTFDPAAEDPVEQTGGRGADYSFEVGGRPDRDDALDDALVLRLAAVEAAETVFRVAHQLRGAIGFCDKTALSWLSRSSHPLRRLPPQPPAASDLGTRPLRAPSPTA